MNFSSGAPRGTVAEFCRWHEDSRAWFYKFRRIVRGQGVSAGLAPGSKAPRHRPGKVLDDCTQMSLASLASRTEDSQTAIAVVGNAIDRYGAPQRFLSDNGSAFNITRRGQRGQLTVFLELLGVRCVTGRPGHPTTHSKNERSHQTLKRYLRTRTPAADLEQLQVIAERFEHEYNTECPYQGIDQATPAEIWAAVEHAEPPQPPEPIAVVGEWAMGHGGDDRRVTIAGTTCHVGGAYTEVPVILMSNYAHVQVFDAEGIELAAYNKVPGAPATSATTNPPGSWSCLARTTITANDRPQPMRQNRPHQTETEPSTLT